jgi:hypothetical protein
MMKRLSFRLGAALILCAALTTGTAWAQGRGHGRSQGAHAVLARDHDHHRDDHFRRTWRGDHDRDDLGFFSWRNSARPPGWSHGRKRGWGNCDLPPGQAKKYGCSSYFWQSPRPPVIIVPRTQRTWFYWPWWGRDHDGDRD